LSCPSRGITMAAAPSAPSPVANCSLYNQIPQGPSTPPRHVASSVSVEKAEHIPRKGQGHGRSHYLPWPTRFDSPIPARFGGSAPTLKVIPRQTTPAPRRFATSKKQKFAKQPVGMIPYRRSAKRRTIAATAASPVAGGKCTASFIRPRKPAVDGVLKMIFPRQPAGSMDGSWRSAQKLRGHRVIPLEATKVRRTSKIDGRARDADRHRSGGAQSSSRQHRRRKSPLRDPRTARPLGTASPPAQ